MLAHSVHTPLDFEFPECGVAVLESHHARGFKMRMQSAPYGKIIHPLDGQGFLHLKNRSEPLGSGSVCLVPPGVAHALSDHQDFPMTLMIVCFRPRVISGPLPAGVAFTRRASDVSLMRRGLRVMFAEQSLRRPAWGTMLAARTLLLLAIFERSRLSASERARRDRRGSLQRVREYLARDRTWHLEPATIDEIAAELQVSRRSFTAAVREITGRSWLDWVRELRVRHAEELLRKTDRSVASIAFECGFEELSSFYRAFKAVSGGSPSRWRREVS